MTSRQKVSKYLIRPFATAHAWRTWLRNNHQKSSGIWMQIYKKGSGKKTVTYADALDEALCYGWIDGQKKAYDAQSYLQKFTPRRPQSMWSKRNREHVERLIRDKRMTAAGLAEIDSAKKDGRWEKAYDAPSTMTVPEDFIEALKRNKKAHEFFKSLNKANVYAIAWRLQTAKNRETRAKRMTALLALMRSRKKIH